MVSDVGVWVKRPLPPRVAVHSLNPRCRSAHPVRLGRSDEQVVKPSSLSASRAGSGESGSPPHPNPPQPTHAYWLFFVFSWSRSWRVAITGMISDTQSLAVTLDNIGVKTRRSEGPVSVKYTLGFEGHRSGYGGGDGDGDWHQRGAFFSRDGLMCTFTMRTLDAV